MTWEKQAATSRDRQRTVRFTGDEERRLLWAADKMDEDPAPFMRMVILQRVSELERLHRR